MYSFDSFGWLSLADIPGRQTDVVPPAHAAAPVVGQPWPNFTGVEWVMVGYSEPNQSVSLEAKAWPAFEFYRKFTMAERIAARELAKTDPVADDFLRTLDNAIASGSNVRADDPDTVAGLGYLSANPAAAPVLATGRAAEILA